MNTAQQESKCRKCKSTKIRFIKQIGFGTTMGLVYHYKVICKNCCAKYHILRTKEVYEKTKNDPWTKTKQFKKVFGDRYVSPEEAEKYKNDA